MKKPPAKLPPSPSKKKVPQKPPDRLPDEPPVKEPPKEDETPSEDPQPIGDPPTKNTQRVKDQPGLRWNKRTKIHGSWYEQWFPHRTVNPSTTLCESNGPLIMAKSVFA